MYPGCIQRFYAVTQPEETRALFKGLRSQLLHLKKLLTGFEASICLPVLHNIGSQGFINAGNIGQKRRRSRIQIHTHVVHGILHNTCQCL